MDGLHLRDATYLQREGVQAPLALLADLSAILTHDFKYDNPRGFWLDDCTCDAHSDQVVRELELRLKGCLERMDLQTDQPPVTAMPLSVAIGPRPAGAGAGGGVGMQCRQLPKYTLLCGGCDTPKLREAFYPSIWKKPLWYQSANGVAVPRRCKECCTAVGLPACDLSGRAGLFVAADTHGATPSLGASKLCGGCRVHKLKRAYDSKMWMDTHTVAALRRCCLGLRRRITSLDPNRALNRHTSQRMVVFTRVRLFPQLLCT